MNRRNDYVPIVPQIERHLDQPFNALPAEVAALVSERLLVTWDCMSPGQRLAAGYQYDAQHDPDMAGFNDHCWALMAKRDELAARQREVEVMPAPLPSEVEAKDRLLEQVRKELHVVNAELDALSTLTYAEALQFRPAAVSATATAPASGMPANPGVAAAGRRARTRAAPTAPKPETPLARRMRRLARLRALGGDLRKAGSSWHMCGERGALAKLVREEQQAGRPMSDKTNVRSDLKRAMGDKRGS